MLLEGPLGTLLAVAIWTVCPCMTPESLGYLLHRLGRLRRAGEIL